MQLRLAHETTLSRVADCACGRIIWSTYVSARLAPRMSGRDVRSPSRLGHDSKRNRLSENTRTDARAQSAFFDDVYVASEKVPEVGNETAGKPWRYVGTCFNEEIDVGVGTRLAARDRAEYTNAGHAVLRRDAQNLFAFIAEDLIDSHVRILRTEGVTPA